MRQRLLKRVIHGRMDQWAGQADPWRDRRSNIQGQTFSGWVHMCSRGAPKAFRLPPKKPSNSSPVPPTVTRTRWFIHLRHTHPGRCQNAILKPTIRAIVSYYIFQRSHRVPANVIPVQVGHYQHTMDNIVLICSKYYLSLTFHVPLNTIKLFVQMQAPLVRLKLHKLPFHFNPF